jgi:hypothetical protein
MIVICGAQMTSSDIGYNFISAPYDTKQWLDSGGYWTPQVADTGRRGAITFSLDYVDTHGAIGSRWVLILKGRQVGDESIGMPIEWTYFDLGPAVGSFDPEYGVIGYGHEFPDHPADNTLELYGSIVPFSLHETRLNQFFTF